MNSTLRLYRQFASVPLVGKKLFSFAYAHKARYFSSVKPEVLTMEPHLGEVRVPKRRAVLNHIGTVHAIAVCNGLEAAMGLLAEATVPEGYRWLPKGLDVEYLAKSSTDVICTARTTEADWAQAPDVKVQVEATLTDGTVVVKGTIPLWVTPKS